MYQKQCIIRLKYTKERKMLFDDRLNWLQLINKRQELEFEVKTRNRDILILK